MTYYAINRFCPGDLVATRQGWSIDARNNRTEVASRAIGVELGSPLLVLAVTPMGRSVLVSSKIGPIWVNVNQDVVGVQAAP